MEHPPPMKIIRMKCLDCSDGHAPEVRRCPVKACPLWHFRMGINPGRVTEGSLAYRNLAEANA